MDKSKDPKEFTEEEQQQRDKLLYKLLKTQPQPRPKRERREAEPKLKPKETRKLAE